VQFLLSLCKLQKSDRPTITSVSLQVKPTRDPGGGLGSRCKGWRWVGLRVGLGIRGCRWV